MSSINDYTQDQIDNYLLTLKTANVDLSSLTSETLNVEIKKIKKLHLKEAKDNPHKIEDLLRKVGIKDVNSDNLNNEIKLWVNSTVDFCNADGVIEHLHSKSVNISFSADVSLIDSGNSITFRNHSTNANSFEWNFGDGSNIIKKQNTSDVKHKFTKSGDITVTLTAENKYSKSSKSIIISVKPPAKPIARLSISNKTLYARSEVLFDDQSSYAQETNWDYGDGENGCEPRHTYKSPGDYNVTLTVSNSEGEDTAAIKISVQSPPKPIAKFSCYTDQKLRIVDREITFKDTSLYAPSKWVWDFGDGTIDSDTGPNVKHAYDKTGSYTIKLTVSNETGECDKPATDKIIVNPAPPKPTGKFTIQNISGKTVTFKNTSTKDVKHYDWDFGDGGTSHETNPNYTYHSSGTFKVTLSVKNDGGEDTFTQDVVIKPSEKPKADFKITKQENIDNRYNVTFANTSKNAVEWEWDFGDGYSDTDKNPPVHIYDQKGNVNVTLKVTNDEGYTDTISKKVKVGSSVTGKNMICCGGVIALIVILVIIFSVITLGGGILVNSDAPQETPTNYESQSGSSSINDINNPSKSSSYTASSETSKTIYSNYIAFDKYGSTYEIKLENTIPITKIILNYDVEDMTYTKRYTDKETGKSKTAVITVPNTDAFFEIVVTDGYGSVVATDGFGGNKYDTGKSDEISLLSGGDYTLSINSKSMGVDITIRQE